MVHTGGNAVGGRLLVGKRLSHRPAANGSVGSSAWVTGSILSNWSIRLDHQTWPTLNTIPVHAQRPLTSNRRQARPGGSAAASSIRMSRKTSSCTVTASRSPGAMVGSFDCSLLNAVMVAVVRRAAYHPMRALHQRVTDSPHRGNPASIHRTVSSPRHCRTHRAATPSPATLAAMRSLKCVSVPSVSAAAIA